MLYVCKLILWSKIINRFCDRSPFSSVFILCFFITEKKALQDFAFQKVPVIKEATEIARRKYLNNGTNRTFEQYLLFEFQRVRDDEKTPIVWKEEEIGNALYETLYSRMRSCGSPDLLMRIPSIDLEHFSIDKIYKK